MESTLMRLDAPELQVIEESEAAQIKATFAPMAEMLSGFEVRYNEIIAESKNGITLELTLKAKRLRLDVGKVRIETGKLKDKQKEYIKLKDRAIMGVHNILVWAVTEKEDNLKELENFFEIQEKKRLEALQSERAELLSLYVEDAHERNLSGMDEDVWNAYLSAKKKEHEDRIEAEKKAEADRIAREKAEAEERERIRLENLQLKKEAEERRLRDAKRNKELAPYIIFIRDYNKMLFLEEKEYAKEFEDIKKGAEQHWEYERKDQIRVHEEEKRRIAKEQAEKKAEEEKARKEREAHEAELKAERAKREIFEKEEREKRQKLESELKAKEEAERKAKEEEEARKQAELNKGDSDKVNDLIADLEALKIKYAFKSAKNQKMYVNVSGLIDKVVSYIKQ